ncbi:hypothetical protein J6590_043865 [Homalodisca vitripennis]|nr:hypothetical protein J6590_043865 [Homalodisca vitripennis]
MPGRNIKEEQLNNQGKMCLMYMPQPQLLEMFLELNMAYSAHNLYVPAGTGRPGIQNGILQVGVPQDTNFFPAPFQPAVILQPRIPSSNSCKSYLVLALFCIIGLVCVVLIHFLVVKPVLDYEGFSSDEEPIPTKMTTATTTSFKTTTSYTNKSHISQL